MAPVTKILPFSETLIIARQDTSPGNDDSSLHDCEVMVSSFSQRLLSQTSSSNSENPGSLPQSTREIILASHNAYTPCAEGLAAHRSQSFHAIAISSGIAPPPPPPPSLYSCGVCTESRLSNNTPTDPQYFAGRQYADMMPSPQKRVHAQGYAVICAGGYAGCLLAGSAAAAAAAAHPGSLALGSEAAASFAAAEAASSAWPARRSAPPRPALAAGGCRAGGSTGRPDGPALPEPTRTANPPSQDARAREGPGGPADRGSGGGGGGGGGDTGGGLGAPGRVGDAGGDGGGAGWAVSPGDDPFHGDWEGW